MMIFVRRGNGANGVWHPGAPPASQRLVRRGSIRTTPPPPGVACEWVVRRRQFIPPRYLVTDL